MSERITTELDPSHGGDVLVIDDEDDLRASTIEVLSLAGFTAVGASGGAQALRRLASAPPRLILLDLSMPDIDGWEVLQVRSESERLAKIPVIVMSAEDGDPSLRPVVDDWLTKPVLESELVAAVTRALGRADAGPARWDRRRRSW